MRGAILRPSPLEPSRETAAPESVRASAAGTPGSLWRVAVYAPENPGRARMESYTRKVFFDAHQVFLHTFYPWLVGFSRPAENPAAVVGIRPAGASPLFVETYLDDPIEGVLARKHGASIPRAEIVEIGNLAIGEPGRARLVIISLIAFLHAAGFSRAVFTAIPKLSNAFARLGLPLEALAPADPRKLSHSERSRWGRYYEHSPHIFAGEVAIGFRSLDQWIGRTGSGIGIIWRDSISEGRRIKNEFMKPAPLPVERP